MPQHAPDYSRRWHTMAAVGVGILLSTVDGSIVNVALPTLVRELQTDLPTVQWVVLSYLLTVTALLIGVGRLGDMIGKKPVYTAGFVGFTIGSALCGMAGGPYWLIGFRVVQAIGAAMIVGLGNAIVTDAFPADERGKALGIVGAIVSIGIVLGPTIGGLIVDAASWRWIFYVNVPLGVVGTLMSARFVPADKPPGGQRFDVLGAVALVVGLLALLLGLSVGHREGFGSERVAFLLSISAAVLAAFVVIERRTAQPMVDLGLFRDRLFAVSLLNGLVAFVAIAGTILLMPFYLQGVLGHEPRQVGLLMAALPVGLGLAAPVSGSWSDRVGTRPIATIGLAILLAGYWGMRSLDTATGALAFAGRFLVLGVGMGVFQSPNNSTIMGAVTRRKLGVASGLLAISRTLGQTTGIAALSALWAARVSFRAGTAGAVSATEAPVAAQVAGLGDTFAALTAMIALPLVLSWWLLVSKPKR